MLFAYALRLASNSRYMYVWGARARNTEDLPHRSGHGQEDCLRSGAAESQHGSYDSGAARVHSPGSNAEPERKHARVASP